MTMYSFQEIALFSVLDDKKKMHPINLVFTGRVTILCVRHKKIF